ncbi:hypothetical protein NYD60_03115 [Burkholderia thailandensis]|uniref:hypothetical protein n=1 Tax=Burkholderia thailandensis TaxID=57975 RepID=UPI00217DCF07|nr:hypothetical protein [Burkholderia thailandensis]MCS6498998.1 hypothetical protein [Burkholderia thailandensis]
MEKLNELLREYAQSIRRDDGTGFMHADAIRELFRARAASANETADERAAFDSEVGNVIADAATRGIAWMAFKVGARYARAASANETGAEEAAEPYDEGDIERHFDDHGFYLHGFEEEDRANFFEAALALVAGRSPAMAAEAVAIPDEATFQRLFIKHGGPVESEGWCINESGLRDFLSDLAAFPQPMTIPAGWMFVPKHRGTKPLAELIIAASLACVENRLLDDDDRHELAQFADQLQHTPQPAQADARVGLTDEQIETLWYEHMGHSIASCRMVSNAIEFVHAIISGVDQ